MTPKVKYKKNGDWNELDLSSGESGSNVSIDDTNTSVDKTWSSDKINKQLKTIANELKNIGSPTQEQINTAIDQAIEDGKITGSGGINSTAKTLLETILRNAIYTTDQSANITSLVSALSSSSGGNTPTITYYTITNTLTNCTNGNSNSSVPENTSYIAIITANTGYKLDTVTVTMGGTDITSTAYNEEQISITSVTGDIIITASAVEVSSVPTLNTQDLIAFFDFRNATVTSSYNLTGWGRVNRIDMIGNDDYFMFDDANKTLVSNDYGISNFNSREIRSKKDETVKLNEINVKNNTIIGLVYGSCACNLYGMLNAANIENQVNFTPAYVNSSETSVKLSSIALNIPGSKNTTYKLWAITEDEEDLKFYVDGQLKYTVNKSECTDFVNWKAYIPGFACHYGGEDQYMTACAYYNRTLSDVEIVEATEYFKTLEVTA